MSDLNRALFSLIAPIVVGSILTLGTWMLWVSVGVYDAGKQNELTTEMSTDLKSIYSRMQNVETTIEVMQAQTKTRDETIIQSLTAINQRLAQGAK